MPELPEVEALAAYLRERAVGRTVERIEVAAISALKTYDPPVSTVAGLPVADATRHGKFLDISVGDLHLVVHLARAANAYSDEILHAAKLSPFAITDRLSAEALDRLYGALRAVLTDAVTRSVGQKAATLKGEKRSGLAVHARTGLPCPVCGDTIREVSFADKSLQYCPTCQTGGKELADRRLSRLVK